MTFCVDVAFPIQDAKNANRVVGINVAIEDFIRAWFRYGEQEKYICRAKDDASFDQFKKLAAEEGVSPEKCIGLHPFTPEQNLQNISCIFREDPALADLAWIRQQLRPPGFATCGLVHTMSGYEAAEAVTNLCLAPTTSADALICPSRAIRDSVLALWATQAEYINNRFHTSFSCPVRTSVIPLGISTDKFLKLAHISNRKKQREALEISDDEIVILFVGRLNFVTKAHPLPLMLAAERAAKNTKKKLRLIFFGYFNPIEGEKDFTDLAADLCKTVTCTFVKNDDPRFKDGFWAGADIFASLVENIQESFGLTPLEAMACGLPAVVTDWDGYRDSVRDGKDGFLIPTLMPPPQAGLDLAKGYFNTRHYGSYLAGSAQSTAVDIEAAAQAFVTLSEDDVLRKKMAASGQQRAQEIYDWRVIIPQYKSLWERLGNEAKAASHALPAFLDEDAVHPAFPNPWTMFRHFPSHTLSPNDRLRVLGNDEELKLILRHPMNHFSPSYILEADGLLNLLHLIQTQEHPKIFEILAHFDMKQQLLLWRSIGWLLKHGLCVLDKA